MASSSKKGQRGGGYNWVILMAATGVSFFQLGIVKVLGVFVPELVDQLEMSASAVGLSCSIGIGLRCILGPIWGALTRITSCRKLIVMGGLLSSLGMIFVSMSESAIHLGCSMALLSIGSGLPIVAKVVIVKDYFEGNFGLANGIAFTGGPLGMTVLAPLVELLIQTYGWRGGMLIFGAMNFNVCVAGALMIQPSKPTKSTSEKRSEETNNSNSQTKRKVVQKSCSNVLRLSASYFGFSLLSRYRVLIVLLSAMAIHEVVVSGWVLFLVSYTISAGYSAQIASFLSALGGAGALVGRLILSPVTDNNRISGRMLFFFLGAGGAAMMFCYPFVDIYWVLGLLSFMSGFFLGSTSPVFVVMLKEVLQDDSDGFGGAVGIHYMTRGIGTLAGGPLTGWLYDTTGNFYLSFITLAALEVVTAVAVLPKSCCLGVCRRKAHTKLSVNRISQDIRGESLEDHVTI